MQRPQKIFLEPWIAETSKVFFEELNKELSEGHPLYGIDLNVVARREDKDEVLFQFKEDLNKYVQVHLTWKMDKEIDPRWPRSRVFSTFEEWVKEVMQVDNEEYEE